MALAARIAAKPAARPAASPAARPAAGPAAKPSTKSASATAHASLLEFATGGGLMDDFDATVIDSAFCEWDYQGAIDHPVLALAVQLEFDGGTVDQYYSAGDLAYFQPSEDGAFAVPVADKQMINDNTNATKFLQSVAEQGGADLLSDGSVKGLIGMKGHFNRVAQPKRQGLIRGGKNADREQTVLLCTAIHEMPGQKTAAAPKKAAAAGKAAAGKAAAGKPNGKAVEEVAEDRADPLAELAQELLLTEILADEQGNAKDPMPKKQINVLAFRAAAKAEKDGRCESKDKQKIVQLLFQDSFLNELAGAGLIEYDGATISLAAA